MPTDKNILISAWSRAEDSAKSYPYMQELCDILAKDYRLIQIGVGKERRLNNCEHRFDMPLKDVELALKCAGFFLSIDNFLHHAAHYFGVPGIVIFGPSDPEIFGYKDQVNIIKDRSLLRKDQFGFYFVDYKWEHSAIGWYPPEIIATMGKIK